MRASFRSILQKAQKPPAGYSPIPKGRKGGYRKRVAGKWAYWYPGDPAPPQIEFDFAAPPEPEPKPLPTDKLEGYRHEIASELDTRSGKAQVAWVERALKAPRLGVQSYFDVAGTNESPTLRAAYDAWMAKMALAVTNVVNQQLENHSAKSPEGILLGVDEAWAYAQGDDPYPEPRELFDFMRGLIYAGRRGLESPVSDMAIIGLTVDQFLEGLSPPDRDKAEALAEAVKNVKEAHPVNISVPEGTTAPQVLQGYLKAFQDEAEREDLQRFNQEQLAKLTRTLRDLEQPAGHAKVGTLDGVPVDKDGESVFARYGHEGPRDPLLQAVVDAGGWQDIQNTFDNLDEIIEDAVKGIEEHLVPPKPGWPRGVLRDDYVQLVQDDPEVRGFQTQGAWGGGSAGGVRTVGVRLALIDYIKANQSGPLTAPDVRNEEYLTDFKRRVKAQLASHLNVDPRGVKTVAGFAAEDHDEFVETLRKGNPLGHWGSAESQNTTARATAVFGDGGRFRPIDKGMQEHVLTDREIESPIKGPGKGLTATHSDPQIHKARMMAMSRYVHAQNQLRRFSREEHPTVYRGQGLKEDLAESLTAGESFPLTGCTAFSYYRETAEHYSSSEWTQRLSGEGKVPVIIELDRTEEFDSTIAGWHAKDRDGADQPAFEIVSGANRIEITEVIPGKTFANTYPVASEAFQRVVEYPEGYLIPVPFEAMDGSRDILPGAFEKLSDGSWRVLGIGKVHGWADTMRGGLGLPGKSKEDGSIITSRQAFLLLRAAQEAFKPTTTVIRGRGVLA